VLAAMLAGPEPAAPALVGRAWREVERAVSMREDARAVRAEARQARERSSQLRGEDA
jgi:hypothetical protein